MPELHARLRVVCTRLIVVAAATVSLASVLSVSVSHPAMATCRPASSGGSPAGTYSGTTASINCDNANDNLNVIAPASTGAINTTGGDETVAITGGTTGATNLGPQNDKYTMSGPAVRSGTLTGDVGNDLIILKGGTYTGNVTLGNAVTSAADIDRLFVFGGTFTGTEFQTGAGKDPYVFLMGGALTGGSVEIRRGAVNPTIVFDGMSIVNAEGIELQSGNATQAAPINPTIYFRSGFWQTGEMELVNTGVAPNPAPSNITVIFDPVNSKGTSYFDALATAATNGGDPTLATAKLNAALFDAPNNPNANHQMILRTEELEFGNGDDKLIFFGAVNSGTGFHNLELQGEQETPGVYEVTELTGGGGIDRLLVDGASILELGEIGGFEFLTVSGGSILTLTDVAYEFGSLHSGSGGILVTGASTLAFEEEDDDPTVITDTVTVTQGSTLSFEAPEVHLTTNALTVDSGSTFSIEEADIASVDAGSILVDNASIFAVEVEAAAITAGTIAIETHSLFSLAGDEVAL